MARDQKCSSTNELQCNTASAQMCCNQILLWTSKCSLRERERMNWSCNFFLSFFLFGLKCNERSGIWLSMNKVFHSAFFSLVFPFSCCVVSFARRRRREMDINQSDILDVHSSMYTWATGTTHRCSNLAGLFLQEDIFTDI